jgi:hypothetical protein
MRKSSILDAITVTRRDGPEIRPQIDIAESTLVDLCAGQIAHQVARIQRDIRPLLLMSPTGSVAPHPHLCFVHKPEFGFMR